MSEALTTFEHMDARVCMYVRQADAWYIATDPDGTAPGVRCSRSHPTEDNLTGRTVG